MLTIIQIDSDVDTIPMLTQMLRPIQMLTLDSEVDTDSDVDATQRTDR